MLWQVLAWLGLVYFVGMIVAMAIAISDLDDNAVDNPRQTMSDTAIMALGYMVTQMVTWPWNAAAYIRSWLREHTQSE